VTGTDPTGTFRFVIPPGDYRLLAVRAPGSSLGGHYWEGPDFLRRYEAMGEPITVAPASRVVVDAEPLSLAN
jgi:hypothetical protein